MRKKSGTLIFRGALNIIKRILLFWLKFLYVIPFFIFGLWLVLIVYFPGFDLNASISLLKYKKQPETVVVTGVQKKKEVPRNHFHMVDDYIEKEDTQAPICTVCHGEYAHGKDEKVRALLNLHDGFMDCTVCHVRKEGTDSNGSLEALGKSPISEFLWVDRDTGEFKNTVEGEYGKYPGKIFPVLDTEQGGRQVPRPITEAAARHFLDVKSGLAPEALEAARKELHAGISKEAVSCSECHTKNGYLDFLKLGFPRRRVDDLVSSEFVGMIDKYKTFYLPSVIDFSGE